MIDPRELRVGNKLALKTGEIVEVEDIFGGYGINSVKGEPEYWKQDLFYIPLTEEWLVKLGFVLFDSNKSWYSIFWSKDSFLVNINVNGNLSIIGYHRRHQNIKYVHTLQNVFRSLTGEELEVKS